MRFVPGLLVGCAIAGTAIAFLGAGCGTVGLPEKGDNARGRELFLEKCGSCHTLADAGTQATIGPNLDHAFSAVRDQGFQESSIRQLVRGQIAYPVEEPQGLVGEGDQQTRAPGMPADLVTGDDADAVASYVTSVAGVKGAAAQPPPPAETVETTETEPSSPPGEGPDLAAGKSVFESAGCASCHALADAGASGTIGPDLDETKPAKDLVVDRVANGKGAMPPFKSQLSDEQIRAVATYVSSVAG